MSFFKKFFKALQDPATLIQAAVLAYFAPGTFFVNFAIFAATSAAATALQPTPEIPNLSGYGDFVSESTNRTQMIKQPAQPRRVVYGEVRLSGTLVFAQTTNSDQDLHLFIALAGHEIDSFQSFRIDDDTVTVDGNGLVTAPSRFKTNLVRLKTKTGADNQDAQSDAVSEISDWTNDHRLRGVAYIYAKLTFDRDAFPQGIPNISSTVRGKKVYDPRTSTTAYSNNPALCIRDYLMDTRYGLACSADEIDDTSFTAAANTCEEQVTLAAGGTQNRYEMNGTFQTNLAPKDILEKMLKSCGGILTYTNGKFRLRVAEYVAPSVTLTEDDLRDAIKISPKVSTSDSYNAIKGVFSPASNDYIATDYPPITSTVFEGQDNNERRFLDYDLPYTTDPAMAQRLAKIALYRARESMTIEMLVNLKGFQLDVGDTVYVTLPRYGFTNKIFEVAEWQLALTAGADLGVNLLLKETSSTVYDWNADESAFVENDTTLPDAFSLPAPSLSVADALLTFNQKATSVLVATVTSTNPTVRRFEVDAKKSTDSDFISLGSSLSNIFQLVDVEDNKLYDVRARSFNSLGVASPYATAQHQIVGKAAAASDVTNFSINIVGNTCHMAWTPVSDPDLSHYRIRHSPLTTGATYANATDLIAKVSRPANTATAPALTGTYFIKAVDKLGNESTNVSSQVAIVDSIGNFNAVQTVNEHPNFTGTKTQTVNVGSELVLDTSVNFDSGTGNFDDGVGLFDGGGGFVATSGTYDFAGVVDLGSSVTSRVTASVTLTRLDYVDLFDSATGNFDDRQGLFDGDPTAFGDTNVELQVATTDDDPNGTSPSFTAFRKFVVGNYKARGLKFKAVLTTTNTETSPSISALSVTVDMPDLFQQDNDISSGTSAKVITFGTPFHTLQAIGIAASNLQSGDFYVITSKSRTGFTIEFRNSSNAIVDRTFDFTAKGF